MKKHANIPIFIPHMGCPNQCVFCNQRTISGVTNFELSDVKDLIERSLATIGEDRDCEIAFFGGSFTGIDRNMMINLLEIANQYVRDGRVMSIRCSTRPDYIDEEILDILEKYSVKTIELGLQSCSDNVLKITKRGHSFDDERRAAGMIVERGFDLVGQMMIGLPGSSPEDELNTARFIVDSGAVAARIYPTVVFYGTELCNMSENKIYSPLGLNEAVDRASEVLDVFIRSNVQVIRIGLCSQDTIFDNENYYAGPNHPALGELVVGEWFYKKILNKIKQYEIIPGDNLKITVSPGSVSKARGQKNINVDRLESLFGISSISFYESKELSDFELKVELERNIKCT